MKIHIVISIDTDRGTRITGVIEAFKNIKDAENCIAEIGKKEGLGNFVDYYYTIRTMELK